METRGYPHVGSVEIGNRDIRRRRAGAGHRCNLGNRRGIAVSEIARPAASGPDAYSSKGSDV
jgi:hypothetical protein